MAHYARVDRKNIVRRVERIENIHLACPDTNEEDEQYGIIYLNSIYGAGLRWVQCSINTREGVHYGEDGNPDGGEAIRKNYPGVGDIYDSSRDAFLRARKSEEDGSDNVPTNFVIDEDTCMYVPPVAMPAWDASKGDKRPHWDKDNNTWIDGKTYAAAYAAEWNT